MQVENYSHVVLSPMYKPAVVKYSEYVQGVYVRCEPVVKTAKDDLIDFRAANKRELAKQIQASFPNAVFSKGKVLTQRESDLANLQAVREQQHFVTPLELETARNRINRAIKDGKITAASTEADIYEVGRREGISLAALNALKADGDAKYQEAIDAESRSLAANMTEQERRSAISMSLLGPKRDWEIFQRHPLLMNYGSSPSNHENFEIFVRACDVMNYGIPSDTQARTLLKFLVNNGHLHMQNGYTRSDRAMFGKGSVKPFTGIYTPPSRIPPQDVDKCVALLMQRYGACRPTLEMLENIGVANPMLMMQALAQRFAKDAAALENKSAAELRQELNQQRIDKNAGLTTEERMRRERRTY